jgi:hypothetical protein
MAKKRRLRKLAHMKQIQEANVGSPEWQTPTIEKIEPAYVSEPIRNWGDATDVETISTPTSQVVVEKVDVEPVPTPVRKKRRRRRRSTTANN